MNGQNFVYNRDEDVTVEYPKVCENLQTDVK